MPDVRPEQPLCEAPAVLPHSLHFCQQFAGGHHLRQHGQCVYAVQPDAGPACTSANSIHASMPLTVMSQHVMRSRCFAQRCSQRHSTTLQALLTCGSLNAGSRPCPCHMRCAIRTYLARPQIAGPSAFQPTTQPNADSACMYLNQHATHGTPCFVSG